MSPIPRQPAPLTATAAGPFTGRVRVAGDKSMSHRALMLGALAIGETRIDGLTESDDILATVSAMRAFGALVTRPAPGAWRVRGLGVGGFLEPEDIIDFGNAGTGVRLAMGLVGSQAIAATFTGDAMLRGRSFGRFLDPLRRMGVQVIARSNDRLPMTIKGPDVTLPLEYRMPVASAQVKSAVLLAGLNTPGVTTIIEPVATRDHTERMLASFGAAIEIDRNADGERVVRLEGRRDLKAQAVTVPGDPSLAAYLVVAALLRDGSDLTIEAVLLNPMRTGLIETLIEMGGDIAVSNRRALGGEEVGDIRVRSSRLRGIVVPPERAPSMIDEYPLLAIAAAFAEGTTRMDGLGELRLKASDRIAMVAAGLAANGVAVEEGPESLAVTGGATSIGGGRVATGHDPRVAMSFLVLGMAGHVGVTIDDFGPVQTSFPEFQSLMSGLGAHFEKAEPPAA
ncbi:3-phosphoshikimate 1-carboxyvinyltransferase [Kaistia sp. 32K]|uniref:3-phosphoshikimate 1-carboxyvinyltransferase n=1 Tax=Kaistia sp. 32K TaxID=2795690 RepID=UPI001916557E|nr:3-phosphoshikimate 1-carboxyvinyltransferase [Kaistia sp. 32K]BCP55911.1 3-phosphoshikimate 1-carboxyvinyltransferase [Kaistia sp. 32K]